MKTINLFFDFEFTSLSPDAQPISLGIVSDEVEQSVRLVDEAEIDKSLSDKELSKYVYDKKLGTEIKNNVSKIFYAEFSDFDINRCDDWVKENVVSKLMLLEFPSELGFSHKDTLKMMSGYGAVSDSRCEKNVSGYTDLIKKELKNWLKQFSDYQIQFVADCGSKDWEWLVQLLAEWEKGKEKSWQPENDRVDWSGWDFEGTITPYVGLPKLPENISPVPFDLNDLIAIKKGITPIEAFDLVREEILPPNEDGSTWGWGGDKHNALFDAIVIKEVYNKLK